MFNKNLAIQSIFWDGKINESVHCRMLWKGYGGWHIQTESFHLLNLSSGRTWVGKVPILQQILGEYNLWSFEMIPRLFHPLLLIFSILLYFCRGGGFVSLENLIFFAQTYPVCFLFLCFNIFSSFVWCSIFSIMFYISDSLIGHIVINVIIFVCMETLRFRLKTT